MSGICGIIHFDGRPLPGAGLDAMAEAAAHRGSDGIHFWQKEGSGLAHLANHVRLEDGYDTQPLHCRDSDLVIVADARVDNRDDLIPRLRSKNLLRDANPSDAALILAAYRRWGEDCAGHLLGDFSFAIWDSRARKLFAARDPMAMRPLYYRREPRRILFASEVKQILDAPDVPASISEPAIARHLAGRFEALSATFYEGIHQLEPGHSLCAGSTGFRTWRHWDLGSVDPVRYRDDREYAEHLRELFTEAVRCRLSGRLPVGVFLSGGLDSGSIASVAGRLLVDGKAACPAVHAYRWTFDRFPECDERHVSDHIVRHYGFEATDIPTENYWPLKDYPKYGPDRDEPFVGVYQGLIEATLADARRRGTGVMFSGDRGDLVMGEYIYDYGGLVWSGQWSTLLKELKKQAQWRDATLLDMVKKFVVKPSLVSLWPLHRLPRVRKVIKQVYRGGAAAAPVIPPWIRPDFAERAGLKQHAAGSTPSSDIKGRARRQRYKAIFTPMHMRGMVWSERTYGRYGQAFADPWSDRRIAEFAMAVPQRVLNRTDEEKRLVRQAMKGIMPERARKEAGKIPPTPYYDHAIRDESSHVIEMLLTDAEADKRGYIDARALRDHYAAVRRGQRDHPYFWWALTVEMWLRQYWT